MIKVIENPMLDKSLLGKPAKDRHDSHYVVVKSASPNDPKCAVYIPAAAGEMEESLFPLYDEFVVFQEAQALLKYILTVRKK